MSRLIAINHMPCTGCKTCELVCSLSHFNESNPMKSAIHVLRREKDGLVFALPLVCQHCESAPCLEACPTEALFQEKNQGNLSIDKEKCSACGLCAEACPIGCLTIYSESKESVSCDLCGGEPQCVMACHAHCLTEVDSNQANEKQNMNYLVKILEQENIQKHLPERRVW